MKLKLLSVVVCLGLMSPMGRSQDVGQRAAQQLDGLFSDPAFARAAWGVKIQSLQTGETLYELNAEKLLMPASNMKLVSAVAAAEILGLDHRFQTALLTDGEIRGGVLRGNLIIRGSGDPTIGARLNSPDLEDVTKGDPLETFREWARLLKSRGIGRIEGDLVGDDRLFDQVLLGEGWSWDDLPFGYAAAVGALQFNENYVLVHMAPGDSPGDAASIRIEPATGHVAVVNHLVTAAPGQELDWHVVRERGNRFILSGTIPTGAGSLAQSLAVEDPTGYFLAVLREVLIQEGIKIGGRAVDLDDWDQELKPELKLLHEHTSPDLRFVLKVLLKISQNLYAETLIHLLDPSLENKSDQEGRKRIERLLTLIGIPEDAYQLADGSGLSRQNLLSAEMIIRLLQHAARSDYGQEFIEMLPIGGVDGTIGTRMKGTAAANNVHAKTGSIFNVRALSGFVDTLGKERLVFSMIVNHFTQSRRTAEYLQDQALQILANLPERR